MAAGAPSVVVVSLIANLISVYLLTRFVHQDSKKEVRQRFVATWFFALGSLILFWFSWYKSAVSFFAMFLLTRTKSLFGYLTHPGELVAIVLFLLGRKTPHDQLPKNMAPVEKFCYDKLKETSRSFYAVILSLHKELRLPVCLFYLTLRALDTIEDDMKPQVQTKVEQLNLFHTHINDNNFTLKGFGDKPEEIELLEKYSNVSQTHNTLDKKYQDVIKEITQKMGAGMAEFLTKKVVTVKDYDLYCHYVAGLVGEGLTKLFANSGLENKTFNTSFELYNSMGLFLQKTNIIRDYFEDIAEVPPRVFYPREIWGKYVPAIEDLKNPVHKQKALDCLNEMIGNALEHGTCVIDYLSLLTEPSVFRFCAIPQVMAIATLHLCYNNYDVFRIKGVKIRKGTTLVLISNCDSMKNVLRVFLHFVNELEAEIPSKDKNSANLKNTLNKLRHKITSHPSFK